MIFGTTDFTYHGHPDPLQCPESMTRKARPAEEVSGEHSTLFRSRHDAEFKLTLSQRLRRVAKDLLPPIVARRLQKRS